MHGHTPEPWDWRQQGDANEFCLINSDKFWVISFLQNGVLSPEKQLANARRIAACVNACAGLSTESLESIATILDKAQHLTLLAESAEKAKMAS